MIHDHRVQVVLGEAEREDGLLRFILEGEGFDVVGLASNDDDLLRVVTGARPEVLVLDAGISAPAAMEARKRANGAAVVVVWPDGVAAVLAEERVDPFDSISDLGGAVRRAAELVERRRTSARVSVAAVPTPIVEEERSRVRAAAVPTARSRGRRGQLLIAAATWMLALTALTAIAIAVPNAMDPSPRHGGGRPSPRVSVTREADERTVPERNGVTTRSCDEQAVGNDSEPVLAGRCPPARGQGDAVRKSKEQGRGRPEDPGSQGQGEDRSGDKGRKANGSSGEEPAGRNESRERGDKGKGTEAPNAETPGTGSRGQEADPAENAGRAENGNAG